ncbi:MAG: hypothetical protein ACRESR_01770 [Gammaproteobacteria bacterium]
MGFFDLLNPWLTRADLFMVDALSPAVRLVVWGVVGAIVSMGLYWLFSPQAMIADLKVRIKRSRRALDAHEGEMKDALPLMGQSLALALKQVVVILVPGVVSAVPLLFLLAWLYTGYGYRLPASYGDIPLRAVPARFHAHWKVGAGMTPPEIVVDGRGSKRVAEIAIKAPIPYVAKRQWWNALFGNRNGYLPGNGRLEYIEVGLPRKTYLPFGPGWARGWEAIFFAVLIVVSIIMKFAFRID